MTEEQIEKAYKWNDKHERHVTKLMSESKGLCAPLEEDMGSPELWKPMHWRWFFTHGA